VYQVLDGVKVVEAAGYLFVPVAGAILADWGAEVIKIEHPRTGDPYRGLRNDYVKPGMPNPMLELPNHGKRSLGLDLASDEGRELMYELLADADVFLTSFMREPLQRLQLDYESVRRVNPRIVYARGSGYGPGGPDADKPGFDSAACWARGGLMWRMTPPNAERPTNQPGSVGDLTGGLSVALGVSAALFKRERTGMGEQVDVSLYGVGMYISAQGLGAANIGLDHDTSGPAGMRNPLVNSYRTADDRWLTLCMIQPDPYWADFCAHIDRDDLVEDPRFKSIDVRDDHADELVQILTEIFAGRTLAEWRAAFVTLEGVWDPALSAREIVEDPQVAENGYFPEVVDGEGVAVTAPDGTVFRSMTAPVQFGGEPVGQLQRMPEVGQHTEEILLERGYDWERIGELKAGGVIT
jgi:crotonobetainyl-CoA:carnitine CoA-transferase CaiB-like acyl-CoA transferase